MPKQIHIYVKDENTKKRLEELAEKSGIKVTTLLNTFLDINEQFNLLDPNWIKRIIQQFKPKDPELDPAKYLPDLGDLNKDKWVEPFDPECEFGNWDSQHQKVYCKCGYPSIIKGNPKNKFVPKEACLKCYPRIKEIQSWIAQKNKEREDQQQHYFDSHGYKVLKKGYSNPL